MIRVRLDEPVGVGGDSVTPSPAAADDWRTLDELAHAALRLAHRLRTQQQESDVHAAGQTADDTTDAGGVGDDGAATDTTRRGAAGGETVDGETIEETCTRVILPSARHGPAGSNEAGESDEATRRADPD